MDDFIKGHQPASTYRIYFEVPLFHMGHLEHSNGGNANSGVLASTAWPTGTGNMQPALLRDQKCWTELICSFPSTRSYNKDQ